MSNDIKIRESNYDLLRVFSAIAVIVIHVSGYFTESLLNGSAVYMDSVCTLVLYNTLSRFAVPCFMMLSGAFLLADDRNADYKYFYRKSFKGIGIQIIIFLFVFFAYSEIVALHGVITNGNRFTELIKPVVSLFKGDLNYHLWYLYTLTGVYILLPMLVRYKNSIGEKTFGIVSWIYLVVAVFSGWTSTFKIEWGIAKVVCYLGFVFVGYWLRKNIVKKNNFHGVLLIITGLLSQLIMAFAQYRYILAGASKTEQKYSLVGNFNPIIVLASVLIFAGFSKLDMKKCRLGNLPKLTFYIYIFHASVLSLVIFVSNKIFGSISNLEILFLFVLLWLL